MTKARKRDKATEAPAKEVPAKDGELFVTYIGEQAAVSYIGASFTRGVPVAVADASPYLNRAYFEVSRGNVHAR